MPENVIPLDAYRPRRVLELICVACFERWIGIVFESAATRDMACPKCARTGAVIPTGDVWATAGPLPSA